MLQPSNADSATNHNISGKILIFRLFLVRAPITRRLQASAKLSLSQSDIPKGLLESQEFGTLSLAFTFVYNVSKIRMSKTAPE